MKKFLALFDLHFGYEKGYVNGKWVTRPTHNLPLVKAVNKFALDFKPDILILGGDQLNCGPISHWHKGKPRLDEGLRLKQEYELLNEYIIKPYDIPEIERKIWLTGNHEQWIEDHINEFPSLEGLIEPHTYLNNNTKTEWEYYQQGHITKIGKLYFTHGDTILGGGRYVNPAEQLLKQTRVNIRCGHLHSYFASTDFNPIRCDDYHTSIVVPCMCSTNTFYMKGKPSKVLNGFLYGYIYPNGDFQDYVVVTHKNKFMVNDKIYETEEKIEEKNIISEATSVKGVKNKILDPLYEEAVKLIRGRGGYSTSYLQVKLAIGFPRASRLTEQLKDNNVL